MLPAIRPVLVLPFVPVMWMIGYAFCGSPSSSTARRVGARRGRGAASPTRPSRAVRTASPASRHAPSASSFRSVFRSDMDESLLPGDGNEHKAPVGVAPCVEARVVFDRGLVLVAVAREKGLIHV